MSTTYAGIDYGRGQSNIDTKTGIRFGVISSNSIDADAFNDAWTQARDLTYEAALAEAKRDFEANKSDDETFDEDEFNDAYGMVDCGERDWLYERDGYKLTNCLQSDVMVLASPYFTYAQFCSPCVPGACNLDSPLHVDTDANEVHQVCADHGIAKTYCLGHDCFDGGQAPYPVYSVETGKRVLPDASTN